MAVKNKSGRQARARRHARLRRRVEGTPDRPRLAVFRSLNHIYAQVINDKLGHTVAAASDVEQELKAQLDGDKSSVATAVGKLIAERAKAVGVTKVVFDRGGNRYHGRVKALADGAREGGLEF
ncbi:MAG: 50S ribosomal protein L18 [Chloroflexi bacterium]|nr:50S ribosomal protein L18 [Chloroflexota bacterium]